MKKQCFYICNEENEAYKIQEKLIKTYINSFCISEEDQNELVVSNRHWKEIYSIEPFSLGFFKTWVNFIEKFETSRFISNLQHLITIVVATQTVFYDEISIRQEYQTHFIFG